MFTNFVFDSSNNLIIHLRGGMGLLIDPSVCEILLCSIRHVPDCRLLKWLSCICNIVASLKFPKYLYIHADKCAILL